ncbi:Alpha-1,2-galactosyltransferase [Tolypocladium ophioglossoides CBS 100239]|uniref:Alpha-1,2-galactosyltransferase n=1 Tax=Tolypocladium ophioglossoides (strain CBS 100239) TaxID=1163406 RepID=A0A0L0N2D3_TOLOC|nr:Alpha-1,2-galactosyltransferase [Tolypocladium ophioglossoides CBS 100239]
MARRITVVHACVATLLTSVCVVFLRLRFYTPTVVTEVHEPNPIDTVTEPLPTYDRLYEDIRGTVLGTDGTITTPTRHLYILTLTREGGAELPQEEAVIDIDAVYQARVGKVSILYGEGSPAYERALRTHEEHNRLHGYSMFVQRESILDGYWTKPAYIQYVLLQELSKPESQRLSWLFWFDADTVVLNYKMPLETFLPPDMDDDLSDVHISVTEDWNGLNNGVFAIRTAPYSVNLLASILAFRDFRPDTILPFQDQSAMEMLLHEPKFAEHAVTVPQRHEAYKYVEVRRGDLLVHFAGVPGREGLMNDWCEQSERQDPEWVVYPEDTSYPAEIKQFWDIVREERRERKDIEQ